MMNPGELTITPYREMGAGIKLVRGYFVHIWIRQIAIYIYFVHTYVFTSSPYRRNKYGEIDFDPCVDRIAGLGQLRHARRTPHG